MERENIDIKDQLQQLSNEKLKEKIKVHSSTVDNFLDELRKRNDVILKSENTLRMIKVLAEKTS